MQTGSTPFLDLADPSFDVTGPAVHEAREESWWARTSYGYAVLRHAEVTALLKDRRFRQGNARWPAQNGVHSGMFSDWWHTVLLSLEGSDHLRLRRLLNPAFKQGAITPMVPGFTELAHELVDGFSERGSVELIGEFAEPYASRVLCRLIGLPESEWAQVAHWADDLGKCFGVRIREDLPRIERALEGLYGYCDAVVHDRTDHPREDLTVVKARVWVETESQKGILIGSGGKMIRAIGTAARTKSSAMLTSVRRWSMRSPVIKMTSGSALANRSGRRVPQSLL